MYRKFLAEADAMNVHMFAPQKACKLDGHLCNWTIYISKLEKKKSFRLISLQVLNVKAEVLFPPTNKSGGRLRVMNSSELI